MMIQRVLLLLGPALLGWGIAHGKEIKLQIPALHKNEGHVFKFVGLGLLAISFFLYYVQWSMPNIAGRWPRIFGKGCPAIESQQLELPNNDALPPSKN